jgi:uncharacterized protein YoxC
MTVEPEFAVSVAVLVATGAASWASVRHKAEQARKDVENLRKEMANTLQSIRQAMDSVSRIAQEADRKSRVGHERIDELEDVTKSLDKSLTRLDTQWQLWARTTQRLQPGEP